MDRVDVSDYERFAAKLKGAEPAVRRAIRKRLREAGKPLGEHVRDEGSGSMPSRGGLRSRLLGSPIAVALKTSGIDIWVGNRRKSQIAPLDRGVLRHPVYGNRKKWVAQDVPEGAYSEAWESASPEVRARFEQVLADVMKELDL